jgi:hypothetical protein
MRRVAGLTAFSIMLASASLSDDQIVRGRLRLTYYECTTPKEVHCFAFDKQQRDQCAPCSFWEVRRLDQELSTLLDADRYLYKKGGKQGSKLLADFGAEVTGKPAQKAPTFRQLYASPKRFDYLEVPKSVPIQPGMDAVYSNFGGIFTASGETTAATPIVYSSLMARGDLKVRQLAAVAPVEQVKTLFNTALFEIRDPAYWNIWPRDETGHSHVKILRPGTSYELRVDLAALEYGSRTSPTSANAKKKLNQLIAGEATSLDLDLVLVTGDEFDDSYDRHQRLHIDRDKMRRWFGTSALPPPSHLLPSDPLKEIEEGGQPDYLFSNGSPFQVRTADSARGMATLTVTMWNGIPLDEMTFTLCIASEEEEKAVCNRPSLLSHGFSGESDLTTPMNNLPVIAISLIAADSNSHVHGILRDNRLGSNGQFVQWDLHRTMDGLRNAVANSLEHALSSEEVLSAGFALYNDIFTTDAARNAFSEAIKEEMDKSLPLESSPPAAWTPPPRLLFRIIDTKGPATLPVSFLAWQRGEGNYEAIGFHYILDLPFGGSNAKQYSECISRWMLLYPSTPPAAAATDAVVMAALRAKATLDGWSVGVHQKFAANDLRKFFDWMATSESETTGAALVMLAHHASDRIWWDPEHPFNAALVKHPFAPPSVAILDGCGTGGSAANEFAKNLSTQHVTAMVVTNTDVPPNLAGDYLNILAEVLRGDASGAGVNLADAHFRAIRLLSGRLNGNERPAMYREHALSFMLIGDGNLKLCEPLEDPRP